MSMTKDEAVDIAQGADGMTLEHLLTAYFSFNAITENTPPWLGNEDMVFLSGDKEFSGKSQGFQMALHAAMGLVTEAGEFLDNFKKDLYGKNRPMRPDNAREELGDLLYYMALAIRGLQSMGYNINFRDIIKDNVVKLANRYIDKFEV
jgi:NTP pyrophosphatase (non-canonical NTP hydrolase)